MAQSKDLSGEHFSVDGTQIFETTRRRTPMQFPQGVALQNAKQRIGQGVNTMRRRVSHLLLHPDSWITQAFRRRDHDGRERRERPTFGLVNGSAAETLNSEERGRRWVAEVATVVATGARSQA